MEKVDYIIVGAGYAGVFFAHQLIKEKKSFKIFYDENISASQISAGVCNPVILKRFNTFWKSQEQINYLEVIFKEIETYTSRNYLINENVVRIFHNDSEKVQWIKNSQKEDLKSYLDPDFIKLKSVENPFEAGKVNQSCRIDVSNFFIDLLNYLENNNYLVKEKFDHQLIDTTNNSYKNIEFKNLIFCEGIASNTNPFFSHIPIQPNKGHCLKVRLSEVPDSYTIKKKHFLFRLHNDDYYYGGTYDRFDMTNNINDESVEELKSGLQEIYNNDFEIQDINVAFRATVADRRPILGKHQEHQNFYIFNGLGARGVYNGSYFSKVLFDFIENNMNLEPEIDVKRFY
ncbi:NAD(P)/FAD-dependent oxidoreductase [Epilithonimonas arachidiradicis]|uniref:FAD-dependent oxidoreductase n=1 Tax=Epilithonimonas arachidiradicis TaxID=1617282 RepID=A0A420D9L7_9FLAO|nr:FAD-dependent oxidoreductase [Epilithonimonas arachidiradicis]RKE87611.1 glycine/D-amino acid oxidase-like deaminating enzyme [Epilithonimonas arachidiradicis]GGG56550.1 FAD-dependent oxidoreductase [Epilithonimonas arachidiradicis]